MVVDTTRVQGEFGVMSLHVVTGAAGFIGSNVVKALLASGVSTSNVLLVDTSSELLYERECAKSFRDVCKFVDFRSFLEDWKNSKIKPQKIFHMGACSSTDELRESYLDEHNLIYSKTVWELSARDQSVLVYASSAATYGGGEHGFSDDPSLIASLKPLNLYGWSKQNFDVFVLDQLAKGIAPKHWAGLKFFNVFGLGEAHKKNQASVAMHAWKQISQSKKLRLFKSHRAAIANGMQQRDFVDVLDCVEVSLACADSKVQSGIYNVGSGFARSFLDLGKAVFSEMGVPPQIEFIDTPEQLRTHYQYYTCADLTRLRAAGYLKPMTSLEQGVARYIRQLKET